MKKLILIISLLTSLSALAQSPQKMSYQAVIRNPSGELVINQEIGIQISILQGEAAEVSVYSETHAPTSNQNGLISIEIGTGNTDDNFSAIDWSNGPYFIKTETDPEGGDSYTITGTSQLLSVPYALHAHTAEILTGEIIESQTINDVLLSGNDANSQQIKNLANPTDAGDAVNKDYMDALSTQVQSLQNSLVAAGLIVIDVDGNAYPIVTIGDQVWMAQNLNVRHYPDGTPIPEIADTNSNGCDDEWLLLENNNTDDAFCYFNDNANGEEIIYGALYTWAAAMGDNAISSNTNPSGVQGICPDGWHLPSDDEWKQLEMFLGMSSEDADSEGQDYRGTNEGSKLAGDAHLWFDDVLEEDPEFGSTGFNAHPGGYRNSFYGFSEAGIITGMHWSSTEKYPNTAYYREIYTGNTGIKRLDYSKSLGLSVRCVKN